MGDELISPPRPSASQAEELQWGAAQEREERRGASELLCTTTLLRRYEERLVPHAQARRGAGRGGGGGGRPGSQWKEVNGGVDSLAERRARNAAQFFFSLIYTFDLF